jgi:hypothetical protein
MKRIALGIGALHLGLFSMIGCGPTAPPTFKVEGKVVFKEDGKLLRGGVVMFESTSPPYIRSSSETDSEGKFRLSTIEEGSGAVAGEHRVRVMPSVPEMISGKMDATKEMSRVLAAKYMDFQTSGIRVTVEPNKENHFVIEIERPQVK